MALNDRQTINQIIMDCLRTGDLSAFNETMEESTKMFLGGVEKTLQAVGDIKTNGQAKPMSEHTESYTHGSATDARMQKINQEKARRQQAEMERRERERKNREKALEARNLKLPVPFVSVGSVSSVICTAVGGIGISFALVSVLRGAWGLIFGTSSLTGTIVGAALCLVFAGVLRSGVSSKRFLEKARRFAGLCGQNKYIGIEELASATNQSVKRTLRDVKRMLRKGFFPEGHIDNDKTTLILSDKVYSEYMRSLNGRKSLMDRKNEPIDTSAKEVGDEKEMDPKLLAFINEGNDYIDTLHRLNDEIPGESISLKLSRLETLLKELFRCVEKHPEQMDRMHEVMEYYIPTVIKLVEAYKEYDSISEAGSEIIDAKSQIEGSIDTINEALKKILNNLFRDSVWDVTTDASVLNTMLAQKGLASPFKQ